MKARQKSSSAGRHYKKARKLLRTTEKWVKGPTADKAELVGEQTGPFEGFVELSVLRKNVDAYRKLLEKLIAWEPDCVIGTMRGGAFLLDVLEVGKGGAELKDIMLRPEKIKPRQAFQQALCELVDDLITKGKRRIVFVDAYMGGFNAEATLEKIFIPNLNKHAASSSGFFGGAEKPLALATFWIRETFGLEKWADLSATCRMICRISSHYPHGSANIWSALVERVRRAVDLWRRRECDYGGCRYDALARV